MVTRRSQRGTPPQSVRLMCDVSMTRRASYKASALTVDRQLHAGLEEGRLQASRLGTRAPVCPSPSLRLLSFTPNLTSASSFQLLLLLQDRYLQLHPFSMLHPPPLPSVTSAS